MVNEEIIQQLNIIFKQVFDNNDIVVDETITAADLEDWDSLNHLQLVVAIEKHYHIRFTAAQTQNWSNVGDIVAAIIQKQSAS